MPMNNYMSRFLENEILILVMIVLSAFVLRIFRLSEVPPPLYIDEVWSVYNPYLIEKGVLVASLREKAVYFLMGNYFTYSVFGASIFFTRVSATAFGTGIVLLVYLIGKEMFCKELGLISAMLITISPWAINLSRYSVPSSNYAFFLTLFVYLSYKGIKSPNIRKKRAYYAAASVVLGLTTYTHIMSIVFIPVFVFGLLLIFNRGLNKSIITSGIKYFTIAMLSASLTIYEYFYSQPVGVAQPRISGAYSTFTLSKDAVDLMTNILERIYYHLSPDFLVFTGGFAFASEKGFLETISYRELFKFTTGKVGMLNYYGIAVYPALVYFISKVVKKSSSKEEKILLWWIFSYAVTSSIAYYDNPHAARNIIGLPALTILMALFMYIGFNQTRTYFKKFFSNRLKILSILLFVTIIASIATPTIYYLSDYFTNYPCRSAWAFNYEYKIVADYLNEKSLWNRSIYVRVYEPIWYSDQLLSFYSPNQPLPSNIFPVRSIEWSKELQNREPGSLYITPFQSNIENFKNFGIVYEYKKAFYFPDGKTALYLVELIMPQKLYPIINEFSEEKRAIELSNWIIGRVPDGLDLNLSQFNSTTILINYKHNGNKDWWYIYKIFNEPVRIEDFPLLEVDWDIQREGGEGPVFIQFLVEDKDGNQIWTSDFRFVFPSKWYNMMGMLEKYPGHIVGIMVGGEVERGEFGEIKLENIEFFKINGVDVSDPNNSKWNYIAVKDGGLLINSGTKVTFQSPKSENCLRPKYLLLSILPLQGSEPYLNFEIKTIAEFETHRFSYIKYDIETPQKILIESKHLENLESIAIYTGSQAILLGMWLGE